MSDDFRGAEHLDVSLLLTLSAYKNRGGWSGFHWLTAVVVQQSAHR